MLFNPANVVCFLVLNCHHIELSASNLNITVIYASSKSMYRQGSMLTSLT